MSELYSRTDKKTSLFGLQVHGPVFFTSASLILLSIVLTLLYRDSASELFSVIQTQVSTKTGWFFILSVNVFLVFIVYLAFSKFGRVRLGGFTGIWGAASSFWTFICVRHRKWAGNPG